MSIGKFFKYGAIGTVAGAAVGAGLGAITGFGILDAITIPMGIIGGAIIVGGISSIVGLFKSSDEKEEIQSQPQISTGQSRQQERAAAIARMQDGQDGPDPAFVRAEDQRRAVAQGAAR